jgi:monooxygenase
MDHVDVLVVGAGISGIGAAHYLKHDCPDRSFVIFEGRDRIGGTWDLFRYPGIRSDSDMFTLGYAFRPWTEAKAIADGPSILNYLDETVRDENLAGRIRLQHRVTGAAWDSATSRWTVSYEAGEARAPGQITCQFLYMGAGYYRYEQGHCPAFPHEERFAGRIVHPQHWPQDLDYAGKSVVVIGSGATAMTLVPAMASVGAGKVTMLQRSPTWVVSRPAEDGFANFLRRSLPSKLAYGLIRWRNILFQLFFYGQTRKNPGKVRERLLEMASAELPPGYDIATHFTPKYNPWDQRLCLVPDADLFQAIKSGKADVVTDTIERFTPEGILLRSGQTLPADIIVTATGLEMQVLGGIPISVDGRSIKPSDLFTYKGFMFSGVPNLCSVFGYTNASWTLKADLVAQYVCRLLNHMRATGTTECRPVPTEGDALEPAPLLDFSSGYVQRAVAHLPKQAAQDPWRMNQNYAKDVFAYRYGTLEDGAMRFSRPSAAPAPAVPAPELATA